MAKKKLESLTNEQVVDYFDACCVELCKAINFAPRREKKCGEEYEKARTELLRRLNGGKDES